MSHGWTLAFMIFVPQDYVKEGWGRQESSLSERWYFNSNSG